MPPTSKKSKNAATRNTNNKTPKNTEKRLKEIQSKMNYICKLNQQLQPASNKTDGGLLTRIKRNIDNNKMVTAFFMLFLNIGSRYIHLNFTSSQEYFIRKLLIPEVLIFSISWMGSRDILIAACITLGYSLLTRILLNENSNFCIVKTRMQEVKQLIDTNNDGHISDSEIDNAIKVLTKAKQEKNGNKNTTSNTNQTNQSNSTTNPKNKPEYSSASKPPKSTSKSNVDNSAFDSNGTIEYPDIDTADINDELTPEQILNMNLNQMAINNNASNLNLENVDLNNIPTFEALRNKEYALHASPVQQHQPIGMHETNLKLEPFTNLPSV